MERVNFLTPVYLSPEIADKAPIWQKMYHQTCEPFFHLWKGHHVTVDINKNVIKNNLPDSWQNCAKRIVVVAIITFLSLGAIPLIVLTIKVAFRLTHKFTDISNKDSSNANSKSDPDPSKVAKSTLAISKKDSSIPHAPSKKTAKIAPKINSSKSAPQDGDELHPYPVGVKSSSGYYYQVKIKMTDTITDFVNNLVEQVNEGNGEKIIPEEVVIAFCGVALEENGRQMWEYRLEYHGAVHLVRVHPLNEKVRALLSPDLLNDVQEIMSFGLITSRVQRGRQNNDFSLLPAFIEKITNVCAKLPLHSTANELKVLTKHLNLLKESFEKLNSTVIEARNLYNIMALSFGKDPGKLILDYAEEEILPSTEASTKLMYRNQPIYLLRANWEYFKKDHFERAVQNTPSSHTIARPPQPVKPSQIVTKNKEENLRLYIKVFNRSHDITCSGEDTVGTIISKLIVEVEKMEKRTIKPEDVILRFGGNSLEPSRQIKEYNPTVSTSIGAVIKQK